MCQYLLKRDVIIFLGCHYLGAAEVVQDPDVGYIQLRKEPVVAGRPRFHLRVSDKQRLLGKVHFRSVHLKDVWEVNDSQQQPC